MTRPPLSLRVTFLALDWWVQATIITSALTCIACGAATLVAIAVRA